MPTLANPCVERIKFLKRIDFTYAVDFVGRDTTAVDAFTLPPGATVLSAMVVTTTAFNSVTSDTMAVGDTDSGTFYHSAADVHVAGSVNSAKGKDYPSGGTIRMAWDGTGTAPTAGAGYLIVEYAINPDFI
jgi:hypothetical protein